MCSCVDEVLDGLNISTLSVWTFDANDAGVLLVTNTLKKDLMTLFLRLFLLDALCRPSFGRTSKRRRLQVD